METLGNWTENSPGSGTAEYEISSTIYIENNGSMWFKGDSANSDGDLGIYQEIDNYGQNDTQVWAFWVYPNVSSGSMNTVVVGYLSTYASTFYDDDHFGVDFDEAQGYRMYLRRGASTYSSGWNAFQKDEWIWMELRKSGTSFKLFANGTEKESRIEAGSQFDDMRYFHIRQRQFWEPGDYFYVDFVRYCDELEFPPTYPPLPPVPPYDMLSEWYWIGLFIASIFIMIWSPSWLAWKIKKSGITDDTIERAGYAMIFFFIGFGLFISTIYM